MVGYTLWAHSQGKNQVFFEKITPPSSKKDAHELTWWQTGEYYIFTRGAPNVQQLTDLVKKKEDKAFENIDD